MIHQYEAKYKFENGYGASVVRGVGTYGGGHGLFELAVMHGKELCYATTITDDVVGHLDHEEDNSLLTDIEQLPINVMDAHYRSFQRETLPELSRRGIGVIGMKSLGGAGQLITAAGLTAEQCRRYSLSLPISTLVCGIRSRKDLQQDLAMARSFKPMTEQEMAALREKTAAAGSDGKLERFKTTRYGSSYHFKQHGE